MSRGARYAIIAAVKCSEEVSSGISGVHRDSYLTKLSSLLAYSLFPSGRQQKTGYSTTFNS